MRELRRYRNISKKGTQRKDSSKRREGRELHLIKEGKMVKSESRGAEAVRKSIGTAV